MFTVLGKKKLINVLKNKPLSPLVKYEVRQIISSYKISRRDIADSASKAIDFWEELREYENSNKIEEYFLSAGYLKEELSNTDYEPDLQNRMSTEVIDEESSEILYEEDAGETESEDFDDDEVYESFDESDEGGDFEPKDDSEFFFDDDLVYDGFLGRGKVHGVKDYLVLGEEEYDLKRNRSLFYVCFLISLPISLIFASLGMLLLDYAGIFFDKIWMLPIVVAGGLGLAYVFYMVLAPQDLVWSYDRVITWSYALTVTYIGVIIFGIAASVFLMRNENYFLKKSSYFKIDAFKTYADKNPKDAEGKMKLAYAYMSNEDPKNALVEINSALSLMPDLAPAQDLHKAIVGIYVVYKEAVIHFCNGMLYWFIEQDKSALDEFNKAIELYPKFGAAHYYLACIYYSQREYEKAWKYALEARSSQYNRAKSLIDELQAFFEAPTQSQ